MNLNRTTPYYAYDLSLLEQSLQKLVEQSERFNFKPHYAMKANANIAILKTIKAFGFGLDCVSGGEVERGLALGFHASEIIFSGVGKRLDELILAIESGVLIQIESLSEFNLVSELSIQYRNTVRIGLRLNPDVSAGAHEKISTGKKSDKFGISNLHLPKLMSSIIENRFLRLESIHMHIGSQIMDMHAFEALALSMNQIIELFDQNRWSRPLINVGGGLGIDYFHPDTNPIADFQSYFETIRVNLNIPEEEPIWCEPGRSVVGQCGDLVTQVLHIKESDDKIFVIVDAGMSDLMRPALYGAYHKIEISESITEANKPIEIVGPICESSDSFGYLEGNRIPIPGSILRIRSAGAYGQSMANSYNLRKIPKEHYFKSSEIDPKSYFYGKDQWNDRRGFEARHRRAFSTVH